jgi:rSAM/selenodomain-associated transferase 1
MSALIVFAKAPGKGIAKSRIAATEGAHAAAAIYEELLSATAALCEAMAYHVAFTGSDDPGALRDYFPDAESFFPQTGASLGDRLRNAFLRLFARGHAAAVAIGCDCPAMRPSDLRISLEKLASSADVVIGPAHDGGYYLIGARQHALCVFDATSWGTSELFTETMSIIETKCLRVHTLQSRGDIDYITDYRRWKQGGDR